MRFAAYGVLSSVLALDLGSAIGAPQIQYGALAILGWMVWYLLAKAFPQHIESQKADRDAFLKAQKEGREAFFEEQATTRMEYQKSFADMAHTVDCFSVVIQECRHRA